MTALANWLPRQEPWLPPAYDESAIYAIRALSTGTANAGQQDTAWRYLMYLTGASEEFADLSFRPEGKGGERATNFAEGKRFIGLMLRKLLRPEFTPHGHITEPKAEPKTPKAKRQYRRKGKSLS